MVNATETGCRLCLVTPTDRRLADLLPHLSDALAAGDVASVLFLKGADEASAWNGALTAGIDMAQAHGAAAVLHHSVSSSGVTGADGVQVGSDTDAVAVALGTYRPDGIVGIGGLDTRHAAMTAAEASPDYLFFGQPDGDLAPGCDREALELAGWWSDIAVVPAIIMGGASAQSVDEAVGQGIEFVALGRAIWDHADGPAAAVKEVGKRLLQPEAVA